MIESLIQAVVGGLAVGATYGLVAIGYSLIYRTTRVINIAQGDLVILAAYIAWTLNVSWSLPMLLVVLIVPVVTGALSVAAERLIFRPLYGKGFLPPIVVSIGLAFVLQSLILLVWGPLGKALPSFLGDTPFTVAGITLVPESLWIFAIGVLMAVLIHELLGRSRVGRAMRTTAHSSHLAKLLGIPAQRMFALAFFLAGAVGAIGGILVAPTTFMQPGLGLTIGIAGFIAATIGGLGNVSGAFLGGLLLGVVGNVATLYIDPSYSQIIIYAVFAVFLLFRPSGIFREEGMAVRDV